MTNDSIEIRVGEFYKIGRGYNQYNKAIFDDVQKIVMVDEEFFQTEENAEAAKEDWAADKYTIARYEFDHMPKDKCEERQRLINEIDKVEEEGRRKYKALVKKIERIDDELDIPYHDGKY